VRVAIVNLFYPPSLAASAHLAASLADHRAAQGDEVTVVSGRGGYMGGVKRGAQSSRTAGAPTVIRLWTPALGKATHVRRLGDYVAFLVGAVVRLLLLPKQDVVIALTTPPYVLVAAVAHRILHPRTKVVLWSHDVYPDAAEAFGTIRLSGFVSRMLRAAARRLMRRVDHVVAVDEAMLNRVLTGYAHDGRPAGSVIPNWEPAARFPRDRRPTPWAGYGEAALVDQFVVLHTGNFGVGHRVEGIADAADTLADDRVTFLFVGGGARVPELTAEVERRNLRNVRFHGYVPRAETAGVLAGARCALISLDNRSLGIMSPSKINSSLAMGLPIVYLGPPGTNVDEAILRYGCGFSLRQGDVAGIVDAVRRLCDDPDLAAELSRNARRAFEDSYCDRQTLPRFDSLLADLTRESGAASAG
jgi:putative colanic acid biosynthesis glycosyltransferase WcaI